MNKHDWNEVYQEYFNGDRDSFVQRVRHRGGFVRYTHEKPSEVIE